MKIKILKIGVISQDGDHLERIVFNNGDVQWKNKSRLSDVMGNEALECERIFHTELAKKAKKFANGKHLLR